MNGKGSLYAGIELAVPDEVFAVRQERKEVVTRVITRLLISLWYEKAFFYVAENYLVIFQCPRTGNFLF